MALKRLAFKLILSMVVAGFCAHTQADNIVATKQDYQSLIDSAHRSMVPTPNWKRVLEFADKALKIQPDSLQASYIRGQALAWMNRTPEAVTALTRVVNGTKPGERLWEQAINTRAWAHLSASEWEDSLADMNTYLARYPGEEDTWYSHADVLHQLKRDNEALVSIQKAIKFNPATVRNYIMKAKILQSLNKHKEAIDACSDAIARDSKCWEAYDLRATSHKACGNFHQQLIDVCRSQAR